MKTSKIKQVVLMTLMLISCQKEDVKPAQSEPSKDCSCDRVVKINSYNTTGETNMLTCYIWTVNDCTNLTKDIKRYFSKGTQPKVGDCYKMPY